MSSFDLFDRITQLNFFGRFIAFSGIALVAVLSVMGFIVLLSVLMFFAQYIFGVYAALVLVIIVTVLFAGLLFAVIAPYV